MRTFASSAGFVMAIVVLIAVCYSVLSEAIGTAWKWLTSKASVCGEIPCPMCGQNVVLSPTDATTGSTTLKLAHRSLNPYREIRRLKVEVADAVACRDETQRLLELQYVSTIDLMRAVNYMSTTGIAIQVKVGKA